MEQVRQMAVLSSHLVHASQLSNKSGINRSALLYKLCTAHSLHTCIDEYAIFTLTSLHCDSCFGDFLQTLGLTEPCLPHRPLSGIS